MKDLKIGWISAAAYATTGYGRMCKEIVSRLIAKGYAVYNIGGIGGTTVWGGKLDYPVSINGKTIKIPVLPTVGQLAGRDVIHEFIKRYELNLLITHWDCFAIDYTQNLPIPTINYLPVDAPFTYNMYNNVRKNHKIVAFSKFGYQELLKWFNPEKIGYIPHGIDTKEWKPITEKERIKVREKMGIDENDFVICTNGANIGERKQLPLIIKVFKKFYKKYQDSHLIMFTNPTVGFPRGYDLRAYAAFNKISHRVYFPEHDPIIDPWTNQALREMYSVSDIYFTMTLGEGFGVPILESMACGTPVIGPRNSTISELVEGTGWVYDTNDDFIFIPVWIPTLQEYPIPSIKSALRALEDAYNNEVKRELFSEVSREFSLEYDWEKVIPLWYELLENTKREILFYNRL